MTDLADPISTLAAGLSQRSVWLDEESVARLEVKYGLTFYHSRPFSREQIKAVFDLFMNEYGTRIRRSRSTSPAGMLEELSEAELERFTSLQLQDLYRQADWGYGFDDGREMDSTVFVFHSFRPVSEPGLASFLRFEFPVTDDPAALARFAVAVARKLEFTSGSCGLVAYPHAFVEQTFDASYAICRRYYGVEAWNLDVTIREIGNRAKSVSWITFLGSALKAECNGAAKLAEAAGFAVADWPGGLAVRSRVQPDLIDRNRNADFTPETTVTKLLRAALMDSHSSFGGTRWNDEEALNWLSRFEADAPWTV